MNKREAFVALAAGNTIRAGDGLPLRVASSGELVDLSGVCVDWGDYYGPFTVHVEPLTYAEIAAEFEKRAERFNETISSKEAWREAARIVRERKP